MPPWTSFVASNHFSGFFTSPLRYPGGKGRLGPWLASLMRANHVQGGCYVEPYAGGAGAALHLLIEGVADHIVINDADPLIYSFWNAAVHHSEELIDAIQNGDVSLEQRARQLAVVANPRAATALQRAYATFFLNRTSRSGILTGGVIGGKEQAGKYLIDARFNKADLVARIQKIGSLKSRISVFNLDALVLLSACAPGFSKDTLVYLDPPYYVKGSQLYRNYYSHADHVSIASYVRSAKHPILVTYDDVKQIRSMYTGIESAKFSLHYSTHLDRPRTTEILFYSNLKLSTPPRLTRARKLDSQEKIAATV
jgi:DNA adenine methylase